MDKIEHENLHQVMGDMYKDQERIKASKADTIIVIQYGNGETVWYSKKDALFAIVWEFELIENIFFAEKGKLK